MQGGEGNTSLIQTEEGTSLNLTTTVHRAEDIALAREGEHMGKGGEEDTPVVLLGGGGDITQVEGGEMEEGIIMVTGQVEISLLITVI